MIGPVLRIAAKDARVELRGREATSAMLILGLLVVTVGLLALGDLPARHAVAAASLWTALVLATSVGLSRAFAAERDQGTLDALLALPIERGTLFLGKALAAAGTVLAVGVAALFSLAIVAAGPALSLATVARLLPLLALGALGLGTLGASLGALAAETRARELMLPVLLLPLSVPVLIAGVTGTAAILAGAPLIGASRQLFLLAGYDIAFLAASWLLFDFIVER